MLKPYMIFSVEGGSVEGACLVFAHNLKEAKRVAWRGCEWEITDEWIDLGARFIRNGGFLYSQANQENLKADMPHVISAPTSCKTCNLWGYPLNDEGYCADCFDDVMADRITTSKVAPPH